MLSRYELVLLYYNGLSDAGKHKLKPLLEKYSMLNNLNESLLVLSLDAIKIIGDSKCRKSPDGKNYIVYNKLCPPRYLLFHIGTNAIGGDDVNDYVVFLTEDKGDANKYHIDAFCSTEEEKERARKQISEFQEMMSKPLDGLPL